MRKGLALGLAAILLLLEGARAADGPRVLRYELAEADKGRELAIATSELAAEVVAKRCRHAGFEGVTVDRDKVDGRRLEVTLPAALVPSEAAVRKLIERRGDVRFRLRAREKMEDEWRDRRLNGGEAPPEGYAWVEDAGSALQALVETPEAPYVAKVDAAVLALGPDPGAVPPDDPRQQTVRDAWNAMKKVTDESDFSNSKIASASVQRAMSTVGAQSLMHVSVRFEFRDDAKAAFEKFTGDNVGRTLCVVVEGKVHVAPVIKSALPGMGLLRAPGMGYTEDEAREMAAILESGPLPLKLVPAKEK